MKEFVNDIWGILLLRGIALLLFGITAVVWPGITFVSLALLFAVYVLVAGMADIVVAIRAASHKRSWFVTFLLGAIEAVVGIYLVRYPTVAVATFVWIIGITFILQGVFALIVSFVDTKDAGIRFLEVIGSVLSILAGLVLLGNPVAGGLTFIWILGIYGIIAGILSIASALSVRHMSTEADKVLSHHGAIAR
jgi:uncharacterized membrane protein HdeD (DUF308 family)